MKNRYFKPIAITISVMLLLLSSCQFWTPKPQQPEKIENQAIEENISLGIPLRLDGSNLPEKENFLLKRESYVLSYNDMNHTPNWVAWHLERDDWGGNSRLENFHADPDLPSEWEKVDASDFSFSQYGFHRGHMCPNGDRSRDDDKQYDTFYMTNMVPQAPFNNTGPWVTFESFIRRQVARHSEAYIVSGPYGTGGYSSTGGQVDVIEAWSPDDNDNPDDDHIYINVPSHTWKVVIILDKSDENDVDRINKGDKVSAYAIWVPNSDEICVEKEYFNKYAVSIDFIEEMTGYDFFNLLDDEIEAEIESRIMDKTPASTLK